MKLQEIDAALRKSPTELGLPVNLWDGKTLSAFIRRQFGVDVGVRQCQRLFRQLGFRLRTPRPVIARADPERQAEYKKNSERSFLFCHYFCDSIINRTHCFGNNSNIFNCFFNILTNNTNSIRNNIIVKSYGCR